jgi:hypothetical protein
MQRRNGGKAQETLDKARIQVRLTLDEARQTEVSVAPVPLDEKTSRNPLLDFTDNSPT